jgi:hypothetical protein
MKYPQPPQALLDRVEADRRKKSSASLARYITERRRSIRRAKDKDIAFVNTWLSTYHAAQNRSR